jgi:hypothetical protein
VPPYAGQRREAGELLDGQRATAVERPLDLEPVVAWWPEPGKVGGDDARAPAHQPLGPVHPEPGPVPEVVRALQIEVVAGPQDGGVARPELGAGPLQLRGADRLAASDAAEIQQARRPDHAVERELLDRGALRVEAQRAVEVRSDVVGGQEDAPLARLRVLVERPGGCMGEPHPELRSEVVDRHALVDRHTEVDHAPEGSHAGPMRRHGRRPVKRGLSQRTRSGILT